MRYFILLMILSCSSPLKYKYSYLQRNLASSSGVDEAVARIEVGLKDEVLFASGLDSTFITAAFYDAEGKLLTNINPADISLSTSEDLDAKPFALKQGIYKSEILPRVKSPSIMLEVEWQGKVKSAPVTLKTTVAPLKSKLLPMHHQFNESRYRGELNVSRGSTWPETGTEDFSFDNVGMNSIVTRESSSRTFTFEYPEQASQNLALQIDDAPNDTVSHTMHSIFMFFPRKQLPVVEQLVNTLEVTLPTGEKVIFEKDSKEIVTGVLEEGPVDVGPDRFKRQYPDIKYKGQGVVLRVNARGQSPQLGQFESLKIDLEHGMKGSADVLIINGSTGARCRRPKKDFWEPLDVNPIEFKFPTDEEFDNYLKAKCGFSLPKL